MGQKRPIYETKETYLWDKRDLLCRARRASCMTMTHAKTFCTYAAEFVHVCMEAVKESAMRSMCTNTHTLSLSLSLCNYLGNDKSHSSTRAHTPTHTHEHKRGLFIGQKRPFDKIQCINARAHTHTHQDAQGPKSARPTQESTQGDRIHPP